MKKIVSILLVMLMVLSMAACSQQPAANTDPAPESSQAVEPSSEAAPAPSGEKTKITLLRPGDETKVHNAIDATVAKFMEDNPDIEVTIQYESWGSWIATYPTSFQAGTQPDVIFWWDKALRDMYAADSIVPIEDYIDPAILEEIPESILNVCKVDGVLYHVPVDMYGFVLFYRKDIFEAAGLDPEAPPKTWEELYECAKAVTENTEAAGIGLPGKAGLESCHEMIAEFICQATGEPLLDENNKVTFNNEKGLEALKYVESLLPYCSPYITDYGRGDVRTALIDGTVAMEMGDSTWAVPTFQAAYATDLDETVIGVAMPPVGPAGNYNWAGLDGWAIAREETAEASGKLINYLCSPEATYLHHSQYGGMPYMQYELEQDAFKYDFWNVFKNSISENTVVQRIGVFSVAPSAYYTDLEPIWQNLLSGDLDAQSALDQVVAAIDTINTTYGMN